MPDPDNAGATGAAPDAGAAEQNPLEGAAAASGGDGAGQNPLEGAASAGNKGGEGGGESAAIPEKFKNEDGSLNSDAMVKSYTELEGRVGSIGMPPKDVSEYKIEYGDLPEGTEINEETQAEFLKGCFEHNMTNDQAQFVLGEHLKTVGAGVADRVAAKKDCTKVLTDEWGGEYNANVEVALKAYNRLASEEDLKDPKAMESVGNNPVMLRILASIGKDLKEDNDPGDGSTFSESEEDMKAMMKSDAYQDRKHPDHATTVQKVTAWHQRAYPKKAG